MRLSIVQNKKFIFLLLALFTVLSTIYFTNNVYSDTTSTISQKLSKGKTKPELEPENSQVNTKIMFKMNDDVKYRPTYKKIDKKYTFNKFKYLPISERCSIYFNELFDDGEESWKFTPRDEEGLNLEDTEMNESLVNMNVFNSCFMDYFDEESYNKLQTHFNIHERFYPYLSGNFPLFQHWNGEIYYGPMMKNLHNANAVKNEQDVDKSIFDYSVENFNYEELNDELKSKPYWKHYKDNMKGKGITVSLADAFMDHGASLIGNLRSIGTDIPVQIFHRGDLSNSNKLSLVNLARKPYKNYKKLDIWFVDVSNVLSEEYKDAFGGYFNKLLAYGFNSFKETILLDSDVVIFHNPDKFFQTKEYLTSRSLFFKDRNVDLQIGDEFLDYLKYNSPKTIDKLFNIHNVELDSKAFTSDYFTEKNYFYMEAGVVAIDRSKYWGGILNTLLLTFLGPIKGASWGDKELIWFALLLSGYDDFMFNEYWSGSIGNLIPNEFGYYSKVCSSHPAHLLNDKNELSWINSGIRNCKKDTDEVIDADFEAINDIEGFSFSTTEDLKNYYQAQISFDAMIIPPISKYMMREEDLTNSNQMSRNWDHPSICLGYIWCAIDQIGDGEILEKHGKLVKFTREQISKYEEISDVYANFV